MSWPHKVHFLSLSVTYGYLCGKQNLEQRCTRFFSKLFSFLPASKAGLLLGPLGQSVHLSILSQLLGYLVCVICKSKSFHSFLFKLHNDCSNIEDVHLLFFAHFAFFFSFLRGVELRHFFHLKCYWDAQYL